MQQTLLNNRYEIDHKIGEGGMAAVYLGRDTRLNRRVAIKILHQQYADDPDFLNRFQHEAQAAALLTHPSIVDVYDVGQDGNIHYIVMEYVEGENLKTLINREAPLSIAQAVAIAAAVAYGLDSAHRKGLIHRDIKPQNLIVTPDGQIRITDFGIAKSDFSTALTQTGITFGTADYISPEQASGRTALPQSDIYSLGVTLYEMLAGQLPFSGDSALSIAMQHVNSEPPPLRQLNPQVPYQLEALIRRAMAKDPADRPESARELAQSLHYYRDQAEQQTMFAPRPLEQEQPTRPSSSRSTGTPPPTANNSGGRNAFPPPRPTVARAPQQGHSCGVFVLGLLLLGGVLSLVLLMSTGIINFAADDPNAPTPLPAAVADQMTVTPTSTRTPAPTPTSTPPTPSPTPSPSPSPTATELALVTVPNIISLPEASARSALTQVQLNPVAGQPRYDSTVPAGLVASQAVAPGSQIRAGQPVTYTLSLGPQLVEVPDLERLNLAEARAIAEGQGLLVSTSEEPSTDLPEGFVIRQEPKNVRVRPGETIFLTVSVGDKIRFPQVIGLPREQAIQVIEANELRLAAVDEQGPDRLANFASFLPNQVISATANGQPVENGQFIPRGSEIVLGVRAP